jgi:predicted HicB family RNase H-like nuclease
MATTVNRVPRLNVTLPEELHRDAKVEATYQGKTLAGFVTDAIRAWVEESKHQREK